MIRRRALQPVLFAAMLAVSSVARADGLGGLVVFSVMIFLAMIPIALVFLVLAFVARESEYTGLRRVFATLSVLSAFLLLWSASSLVERSLVQSLNPWWGSDAAFVAPVCLAILLGNVLFFLRSRTLWVLASLGVVALVAFQFVYTPGRSIYYEHDPLTGNVTQLWGEDRYHVLWGDQILRIAEGGVWTSQSRSALVEPNADGSFTVTVARRNIDPRVRNSSRQNQSGWGYRFPVQPSHIAAVITDSAVLVDEIE